MACRIIDVSGPQHFNSGCRDQPRLSGAVAVGNIFYRASAVRGGAAEATSAQQLVSLPIVTRKGY